MFHILIAEDDSELNQLFQHVLRRSGYEATGVENGVQALEALDNAYYDLIISDVMMPGMDGLELVSALRENGNNIPVLMITAKDAFDDMRSGFASGTDDYMVKPVNIDVYKRQVVDGKSILGIFSLDLSKPITLEVYSDHCDDLLEELKPYIIG